MGGLLRSPVFIGRLRYAFISQVKMCFALADCVEESVKASFTDDCQIRVTCELSATNQYTKKAQSVQHGALVMVFLLLSVYPSHFALALNLSVSGLCHHAQR